MYTIAEIRKIREEIVSRELEAPDMWCIVTDSDLQQFCNGCGPEDAPDIIRKGLTGFLKRYQAAFVIHDIDYMFSQKDEADSRMRRNMIKIWKQDFQFWRYFSKPGLLNRFIVIPAVYSAVKLGGTDAYKKAQRRGQR